MKANALSVTFKYLKDVRKKVIQVNNDTKEEKILTNELSPNIMLCNQINFISK